MARFARLAAQQELELGQNETTTCSTRPGNARARPGARPRAHVRACDYKADPGFDRTPHSLSTLPERQFTGDHSAHGVPAAARALATVNRPFQPSSTPTNPSASLP
jgi:hypothetical protein